MSREAWESYKIEFFQMSSEIKVRSQGPRSICHLSIRDIQGTGFPYDGANNLGIYEQQI